MMPPVLVFSNSLGTTGVMWDAQAAALSDRFRVLRYDARGHGGTPAPRGPYTVGDLAGDVIDLLDRLELERVSFCGLSIGGMTGHVARGERPRAHRPAGDLLHRDAAADRRDVDRARGARYGRREWARVVDATMERWFTPGFPERSPEVVARIREIFLTTDPEGYAGCCEALPSSTCAASSARSAPRRW